MIQNVTPLVVKHRKVSYDAMKRVVDFTAAALALIVFAIPMLFIALAVKVDSRGTVIYRQERLGKDGVPFMLIKFRSMRMDAETNGAQWACKDDCRTTRVGKVLRSTRMDELPQLWNILKGEMSFVGPRPERECFYKEFKASVKDFHYRLAVIPGLTGTAQVNGGYELSPAEKLIFDMEYIHERSFLIDIKTILKTISIIFSREGAR